MTGLHRTRVAGQGSYLPEKILSNADLEKIVDTNDQWIVDRTGIRRRHIAADDEVTSDLAYQASVRAIADAGLTAHDIDLIIVGTVSGDSPMPSTACILQAKLGCRTVMAFDLSAACTGFIYGLSIADQFIRTGTHKNVLVVGVEILSRLMNYQDRETCILFGDGAGAWVVSRAEDNDPNVILSAHNRADGNLWDLLYIPGGGSRIRWSPEAHARGDFFMKMKGRDIFKNAVRTMAQTCEEALETNKVTLEQVDWLVPHQANIRIIEAVANQFDFPMAKVVTCVEETGNTSAATIPLAFSAGIREGKIKRGQTILLTAFGAGLTSGSLLMRY